MPKAALWGIAEPVRVVQNSDETAQKIKNKIDTAKTVDAKKVIKSTKIPLEDKLKIIEADVHRILGKYEKDTQIIKTKEELIAYIDKAIEYGEIAIDTETNNSLDPITCKIMGGCIYTPGLKNAYIPINHVDIHTRKRLNWQLTEQDLKEQFDRLTNTKIIMHNGKFDYQVIKCTCNSILDIYWDTLVGARILNENERAGLKEQYREKIDPNQEKYDIEHLFQGLEYAIVSPELFALYAATDSKITYELYKWQVNEFNKPEHNKLFWVFKNVEMPVVEVTAEMELTGITIDKDYAKLLSDKYHKQLDEIQSEIDSALKDIEPKINKWRNSADANYHEVNEKGKVLEELKSYIGDRLIENNGAFYVDDITYKQYDKSYKFKKSKSEQLENPPSVASPTQLAILLYDVLKVKVVDKKSPRGTGEDILKEIDNPICSLILKLRGINKLINTYVDKLPECVCEKDGRLHAHFNQLGTDCITKESLLLTEKGYCRIGDIFNGDEVDGNYYQHNLPIINKNLEKEYSSHRIVYHNVPTIKLYLRGGQTIEGTYNHPIICSGITEKDLYRNHSNAQKKRLKDTEHFKELSDISVGDLVAIPLGYGIFPTEYQRLNCSLSDVITNNHKDCIMPEYCNEEFAELLGMYFADGSLKTDNKFVINISNKDKEVQNRVRYLVKNLFNLDTNIYSDKITTSIMFGSTRIKELEKYFPVGARDKIVPDIIMKSPKSVICSFIRGLTLDSTFEKNRQRLKITVANPYTNNFVCSVLYNLGINHQINRMTYKSGKNHSNNIVNELATSRIGVSGKMYKKFIDIIGTVQSSKSMLFDEYKNNSGYIIDNTFYAEVIKIEYLTNDVYDLHVPDTHSFIANGVINHNTGRFSSTDPNLQNIPSHNKNIRMMFVPGSQEDIINFENSVILNNCWKVYTNKGLISADDITIGDIIYMDEHMSDSMIVSNIIDKGTEKIFS